MKIIRIRSILWASANNMLPIQIVIFVKNLRQLQSLYQLNWIGLLPDHHRSHLTNFESSNDFLDRIEERLQMGFSPSSIEDVALAKRIIKFFDKVRQLATQHPDLDSQLNVMLRRIFENMSTKFSDSDPKFNLVCEYCDGEFPLLNNDVQFSLQMHHQTSEHEAAMKDFELIYRPLLSDKTTFNAHGDCVQQVRKNLPPVQASSSNKVKSANQISTISRSSSGAGDVVDRWIRGTGSNRHCILCEAKLPNEYNFKQHISARMHREDDEWVSIVGSQYFCDLCNVNSGSIDSLKNHLDSRRHKNEIATISEYFEFICSKKMNDVSISSLINTIYSPNLKIRLTYFLNKTCIFRSRDSVHYECVLCKMDAIKLDEGLIHNHLLTNMHATRLKQVISNCDQNSVSFEVGFICDDKNKKNKRKKCCLCNVEFYNAETHLRCDIHKKWVNTHFESTRFKNWERGIILRSGLPYCIACELILGDAISMRLHINDPQHKGKFWSCILRQTH